MIMGQRNETNMTLHLIKKNPSNSLSSILASVEIGLCIVRAKLKYSVQFRSPNNIKTEPDDSRNRSGTPQRIGPREDWKGVFQLCEDLTGMGE